ncbi:MAG: M20/M25/M40 family metallo-hydrolase [Gammaproteobacteria bacterium]|nr:M20/M25/M40 family metallo-hydrolase [Gammaproteobacteria bacterium]
MSGPSPGIQRTGAALPLRTAVCGALFAGVLVVAAAGRPASAQAPAPRPIPSGVLGGVPMTAADSVARQIVARLDMDSYRLLIEGLAGFGDREQGTERNARAVDWIEERLRGWGYTTERFRYEYEGEQREQVYATKVGVGAPDEMYILGAHMDGRGGGDAVNDNASGTALVLEIARVLASPDIRTDRSVRFALWNNEETGLNGARAYVEERAPIQGVEDPPGSGRYPEPTWLGMIQHDKVMFDRGNPVQATQALNADVDVEFQLNSTMWEESARLAVELINANRMFATHHPAAMSNAMSNTDSTPFMDLVAAVSVRENRRRYEIGRGSDPHWHQPTDVLATFSDADYRLGFSAMETTLGATARLAGAEVVPLRAEGAAALAALAPEVTLRRARLIHRRVVPLDTHVDIDAGDFDAELPNYVSGLDDTQVDLPSMETGGLDAAFFSLFQAQRDDFTPSGYLRAYNTAMDKALAVRRLTSELAPERIGLARTAADVRRIAGEGRLVALLGMENGYALGEDADNVRRFAELGVRYLSLAHNGNNQLSDSHTGEADGYRWNGVSPLGREVIAEANRRGVVLDISHPSKAANLETMRLSLSPVMASHSSVRSLADHSRNLDDEQLLALRENGGVVQVVAFPAYLRTPSASRTGALRELRAEFGLPGGGGALRNAVAALEPGPRTEYDRRLAEIDARWPPPPPATVTDLVDHIDYVVDLIGIDHVGISSDFDGGGGIGGWNDASETFNVTLELVRRGYTEEEISKIWSGNLLRVLEEAERVAGDLGESGAD